MSDFPLAAAARSVHEVATSYVPENMWVVLQGLERLLEVPGEVACTVCSNGGRSA